MRYSVAFLMEEPYTIECPFCGAAFELLIDTSIPEQEFVSDCENCCRPLHLSIQAEPGMVSSVQVDSG